MDTLLEAWKVLCPADPHLLVNLGLADEDGIPTMAGNFLGVWREVKIREGTPILVSGSLVELLKKLKYDCDLDEITVDMVAYYLIWRGDQSRMILSPTQQSINLSIPAKAREGWEMLDAAEKRTVWRALQLIGLVHTGSSLREVHSRVQKIEGGIYFGEIQLGPVIGF